MPNQNRKQKAGESSIQGVGIALVATGAGMVNGSRVAIGLVAIALGVLMIYISVTFRNMSIGIRPDEVVEAISQSKDELVELTEDETN